VQNLVFSYNGHPALQDISLDIGQGEFVALMGRNGAGKTTLLKILCCLVLPDEGQAIVAGERTENENRVKPNIGLVHSDERSFYWRLSARENLRFFARLYNLQGGEIDSRIDVTTADKAAILEAARARNLVIGPDRIHLCGMRINLL